MRFIEAIIHPKHMGIDRLGFSPKTDQEIHNFRREIMKFFPTTMSGVLKHELKGIVWSKLLGQKGTVIKNLTVPHFQALSEDLTASSSESTLLGVFAAEKLHNLRDLNLRQLGIPVEPRPSLSEKTIEAILDALTNTQSHRLVTEDETNIRSWCLGLKLFSQEYMTRMTAPTDSFNSRQVASLIKQYPERIAHLRAPIQELTNWDFEIMFRPN